LAVFPNKLNIDHDLPVIDKLTDTRVVFAVLFLLTLLFLFWFFKDKLPFSLFAYLSYLLLMAPSNSFILRGGYWMTDPLSERNLYAPAFFFTIILLEVVLFFCSKDLRKFKMVLIAVLLVFSVRVFVRNIDFRSNLNLWKASVKYSPNRARPNFNYATALKDRGLLKDALPYAKKALKLSPGENTLGLLSTIYRLSGDNYKYEQLLKNAIEQKRFQKPAIYHQLGEFYSEQGDYKNAKKYFRLAIKLRKGKRFILPRLSLVYILINENKLEEAKKPLKNLNMVIDKQKGKYFNGVLIDRVIESRVLFANSLYYFAMKNEEKGVEFANKSLEANPLFTEPYLKLAEYYYIKRKDKIAWEYLYKASKTPDYSKYQKQIKPMVIELQKSLKK
jgi:tetratricopeptide (TPR) repeat protein